MRDERVVLLANIRGCKKIYAFQLSWAPMGSTRPKVDDRMPMVSRLDKRLSRIPSMMPYFGRLMHLAAYALPIFAMFHVRVPFTILDHFQKDC